MKKKRLFENQGKEINFFYTSHLELRLESLRRYQEIKREIKNITTV